ncbi:hypothetical protein [Microvirga arabica]|uniref:hypothetical protein n=1 Tax=Microvirga arabica TaxID=1128671 RepID=UPI001939F575|nr:hypothetical protein [Microvirga arabica]MBM1173572.1 hypothetical protein [Microvirga arabica]
MTKNDNDPHRGRARALHKAGDSPDLGRSDKKDEAQLQSEPLPDDAVKTRGGKNWIDFLKSLPLY